MENLIAITGGVIGALLYRFLFVRKTIYLHGIYTNGYLTVRVTSIKPEEVHFESEDYTGYIDRFDFLKQFTLVEDVTEEVIKEIEGDEE